MLNLGGRSAPSLECFANGKESRNCTTSRRNRHFRQKTQKTVFSLSCSAPLWCLKRLPIRKKKKGAMTPRWRPSGNHAPCGPATSVPDWLLHIHLGILQCPNWVSKQSVWNHPKKVGPLDHAQKSPQNLQVFGALKFSPQLQILIRKISMCSSSY